MQVESYLKIISEPQLPSLFLQVDFAFGLLHVQCFIHMESMLLTFVFKLQVISWVLGEYGTADGKYSASYISGKLCDVADAYSSDETVKVVPQHSNIMHRETFACLGV